MGIKKQLGISVLTLSVVFAGFSQSAFAKTESEVSVEAWDDSVSVYGKYLETDEANREVTSKLIGTEDTDEVGYVSAIDTYEYIGLNSTDESLKSSIRIKRTPEGTGLNLEINKDGGDITLVTEEMYRNALITSGFHDAEVTIASFQDVTGESALSGVFKAQEIKGETVNPERTSLAQEELNTVVEINEDNKGTEGYSQEQLNKAIAEMKTLVAEEGGELTEERVREIVDQVLEDNGLNDYLNDASREQLVIIIIKGQDLGIFSGESAEKFIESGKSLVDNISESDEFKKAKEKAGELGNKISDKVSDEGFWDKVKELVGSFLDMVSGWFTGGTEETTE